MKKAHDTSTTESEENNFLTYAEQGHLDAVTRLIEQTPELLTYCDEFGNTALHRAAFAGRLDVLQALVTATKVSALEQPNQRGQTPAHLAAWQGHKDVLKYCLKNVPDTSRMTDKFGNTPLFCALENNHAHLVPMLVNHDRDCLTHQNAENRLPLFFAAQFPPYDGVKALLDVEPDLITQQNERNSTLTFYACTTKNIQLLEICLRRGEGKKELVLNLGAHFVTPIQVCFRNGFSEGIRAILREHKNLQHDVVTCKLEKKTLAILLTEHQQLDILTSCIEEDKTILQQRDNFGHTVTHYFAFDASLDMLRLCLEADPSVLSLATFGASKYTPMQLAYSSNQFSAFKLCQEHDPRSIGDQQADLMQAILHFVKYNNVAAVQYLDHPDRLQSVDYRRILQVVDGNTEYCDYKKADDHYDVFDYCVEQDPSLLHYEPTQEPTTTLAHHFIARNRPDLLKRCLINNTSMLRITEPFHTYWPVSQAAFNEHYDLMRICMLYDPMGLVLNPNQLELMFRHPAFGRQNFSQMFTPLLESAFERLRETHPQLKLDPTIQQQLITAFVQEGKMDPQSIQETLRLVHFLQNPLAPEHHLGQTRGQTLGLVALAIGAFVLCGILAATLTPASMLIGLSVLSQLQTAIASYVTGATLAGVALTMFGAGLYFWSKHNAASDPINAVKMTVGEALKSTVVAEKVGLGSKGET